MPYRIRYPALQEVSHTGDDDDNDKDDVEALCDMDTRCIVTIKKHSDEKPFVQELFSVFMANKTRLIALVSPTATIRTCGWFTGPLIL